MEGEAFFSTTLPNLDHVELQAAVFMLRFKVNANGSILQLGTKSHQSLEVFINVFKHCSVTFKIFQLIWKNY